MLMPLTWLIVGVSALIALVALVQVAVNRLPGGLLLTLLFALEALLFVQLFVGIWKLGDPAHQDIDKLTFVGYLGAALLVPPAGALWAAGERSRAGTAIYVALGLLVPFLVLRLVQIWGA